MERKNNQLTFLNNIASELGGKRTAEFFAKCDKFIPWEQLAEPLKDMYKNNSSNGGASNWPVVMMIKCMMLQKWFRINSDPELENQINDRISFKKFLGLPLDKPSPDHSTFSRFRSRISKEAMIELNSEVLGEFAKRGLSINEGIASGLEGIRN